MLVVDIQYTVKTSEPTLFSVRFVFVVKTVFMRVPGGVWWTNYDVFYFDILKQVQLTIYFD